MLVTRKSRFSGKVSTIDIPGVTQEQLDEAALPLSQRRLMQDIMPNLTPFQRDFIINGLTEEDWAAMAEDETELEVEDELDTYEDGGPGAGSEGFETDGSMTGSEPE